jgi:hypothetical protein
MFTPEILSVSAFNGLGSGVVLSPSGALLVSVLIGAFVSSALGLLWEAFRAPHQRAGKRTSDRQPASLARNHGYSEAIGIVRQILRSVA